MVRLFLDANTIVSGLFFSGNEAHLLEYGSKGLCELITSRYVVAEVRDALRSRFFRLTEDEIAELIKQLCQIVIIIENPQESRIRDYYNDLRDKKDIPIIVSAIDSGCDFLVTGDKELLSQKRIKAIKTTKAIEKIMNA